MELKESDVKAIDIAMSIIKKAEFPRMDGGEIIAIYQGMAGLLDLKDRIKHKLFQDAMPSAPKPIEKPVSKPVAKETPKPMKKVGKSSKGGLKK